MRLYLDTSVYSGYYDEIHHEHTKVLFDRINERGIDVIVSVFVNDELKRASHIKKRNSLSLLDKFKVVTPTPRQQIKVNTLVDAYIKEGVLTKNCEVDAMHVAFAVISNATVVVSNNMRHMVNRQNQFNVLNLRLFDKTITILRPQEIIKTLQGYENLQKK